MIRGKFGKKAMATVLVMALGLSGMVNPVGEKAEAAKKKVSLKKTTIKLKVTQNKDKLTHGSAKIAIKKAKGVKVKNVSYKVLDKTIVKVNKSGKVTALDAGATTVKVTVKYKYKKKKISKTTLTCKIKVGFVYKNMFVDMRLLRENFATYVGGTEGVSPRFLAREDILGHGYFYSWDYLDVTVADSSIVHVGMNAAGSEARADDGHGTNDRRKQSGGEG